MSSYKAEIYAPIGEQARLHPVYAALVWLIAMGVMLVVQGVAMIPAGLAGWLNADATGAMNNYGLFYVLAIGFGAVSLASFAWVKWVENRSLASMGWRLEQAFSRYWRGFAIGIAMNIAAIILIGLLGGYETGMWAPAIAAPAALGFIFLFLIGFIIQGGTEEVLVRGWMMSSMASRFGIPIAVGVTSSLFALLHLPNEWPHVNLIAMANIVLVGVFFAIYALRQRSLIGVCAVHSSWNWIMSVGFGLNVSGQTINVEPLVVALTQKEETATWITGGSFGPEGSIIVTLVLAVSTILVWRMPQQPD